MLTILYPFRNREPERVKRSLDSLKEQSCQAFKVWFVDYGSTVKVAEQIKSLVESYVFSSYLYSYTQGQPWSRSRAINTGLKQIEDGFVFVADIDIIFHPDFISNLQPFKKPFQATYFCVGFLSEQESLQTKKFENYNIKHVSGPGAAGLSLFPVKPLKALGGFDEFFHFWGAEDENIHARFKNAGYQSIFYSNNVLLLHQWHPSYRTKKSSLTGTLRLPNISRINKSYNEQSQKINQTVANIGKDWGRLVTEYDFIKLQSIDFNFDYLTLQEHVDVFSQGVLELPENHVFCIVFQEPSLVFKIKQCIKRVLKKDYIPFYSIKAAHAKLLLGVVSYGQDVYIYEVVSKKTIQITIKT